MCAMFSTAGQELSVALYARATCSYRRYGIGLGGTCLHLLSSCLNSASARPTDFFRRRPPTLVPSPSTCRQLHPLLSVWPAEACLHRIRPSSTRSSVRPLASAMKGLLAAAMPLRQMRPSAAAAVAKHGSRRCFSVSPRVQLHYGFIGLGRIGWLPHRPCSSVLL